MVALADGLGSAACAEQGADMAVKQAIREWTNILAERLPMSEQAWKQAAYDVFEAARHEIAIHAQENGLTTHDYATTLAFAVYVPGFLLVGQIGDGFIVIHDNSGNLQILIEPQRGEYANEVLPLTSKDALSGAQIVIYTNELTSLCMSTDGMLRLALKLPTCEPYPKFFLPLWRSARAAQDEATGDQQLTAFLNSPRVCEQTEDDKTLILAVKLESK